MDQEQERVRALLMGFSLQGEPLSLREESLKELARLADTAGIAVVGRRIQRGDRVRHDTYVGPGFLERCLQEVPDGVDILLFDHDLTGSQVRNIEGRFPVEVMDRTEVILKIFQENARTREAKLQVRLAELKYQMPRLKRQWVHLDREGGSTRGGGALRGMGEKQLEKDRRRLQREIFEIERRLEKMVTRLTEQRRGRKRNAVTVTLVGYTNTGKSTLFNRLTGAEVLVEDRLFATLDSTSRRMRLQGRARTVVLSDTVGFIANLPHHLVASFRATLKEAREADLLLHVVDLSDPAYERHMADVQKVLEEIGAKEIPRRLVFNKIDKVSGADLQTAREAWPGAFFVSAREGIDIQALVEGLVAITGAMAPGVISG